jgi:hypothetical protein
VLFLIDLFTKSSLFDQINEHVHGTAIAISLIFTVCSIILTGIQIIDHLDNFKHHSQSLVIKILFIVPVFSTCSFLATIFLNLGMYFELIRVCYEAYVIYAFLLLLIQYMGGNNGVLLLFSNKNNSKWPFPLCYVQEQMLTPQFLYNIKYGVLQYVLLQPVFSVVSMLLDMLNVYNDGDFDYRYGYLYVFIIKNISQTIAFYCLVWLYVVIKDELTDINILYKFASIKLIIFCIFWQNSLITLLVDADMVKNIDIFNVTQIHNGLQNFIICIEMFAASIVHKYVFDVESYISNSIVDKMEKLKETADSVIIPSQKEKENDIANRNYFSTTNIGSYLLLNDV